MLSVGKKTDSERANGRDDSSVVNNSKLIVLDRKTTSS